MELYKFHLFSKTEQNTFLAPLQQQQQQLLLLLILRSNTKLKTSRILSALSEKYTPSILLTAMLKPVKKNVVCCYKLSTLISIGFKFTRATKQDGANRLSICFSCGGLSV